MSPGPTGPGPARSDDQGAGAPRNRRVVWKFGGTSVADADRLGAVARRLVAARRQGLQVVAVLSAMGGTTDELVQMAYGLAAEPQPRELDALLSTGEVVSCSLAAMAVHELGERAVSLAGSQAGIVTDESHGVTLARALRPALDATNLIPPAPKPAHPRARGTEPPMTLALAQMHRATAHTGSWSALSAPRRSPLTGHPAFRPCTPCPTAHISIQIFTEFTSGASLRNAVQPRLTCNHGLICDRGSNGLLDLLPEVSRSPEERLSATASAQCPTAWGA